MTSELHLNEQIKQYLKDFHISIQQENKYQYKPSQQKICQIFKVEQIEEIGVNLSPLEIQASGALLDYVLETQCGKIPTLSKPQPFVHQKIMSINSAARNSLELFHSSKGTKSGSLISVIDKCETSIGIFF